MNMVFITIIFEGIKGSRQMGGNPLIILVPRENGKKVVVGKGSTKYYRKLCFFIKFPNKKGIVVR